MKPPNIQGGFAAPWDPSQWEGHVGPTGRRLFIFVRAANGRWTVGIGHTMIEAEIGRLFEKEGQYTGRLDEGRMPRFAHNVFWEFWETLPTARKRELGGI